ncbi:unnamed protein product [Hymenolepis diminuta]|uniref:Uncharacterized protein n=1 Tax=Hymenolepis diminuta TaxID=6216 RepID=A0A564Y9G4_HYMDI|nr:unnamed protein product [Hymenolepis diminuta]
MGIEKVVVCRLQGQAGGLKKAFFCRTGDNADVRTGEVSLRDNCASLGVFAAWLTFLCVISIYPMIEADLILLFRWTI